MHSESTLETLDRLNTTIADYNEFVVLFGYSNSKTSELSSFLNANQTEVFFYDCPILEENRNASLDLITTFALKKILLPRSKVKFVVVIDHGSDQANWIKLFGHVNNLIPPFDKYQHSIGTVVSYLASVNDHRITTIKFQEFIKNFHPSCAYLGIFKYDKLQPSLEVNKSIISEVRTKIQYVIVEENDFPNLLSTLMKDDIKILMNRINENMISQIIHSWTKIEEFHVHLTNIHFVEKTIAKIIKSDDIQQYLVIFANFPDIDLAGIRKQEKYFHLLRLIHPEKLTIDSDDLNNHVEHTKHWLGFMIKLIKEVSKYERLGNPLVSYSRLKSKIQTLKEGWIEMKGKDLESLLDDLSDKKKYKFNYDLIKNLQIDVTRATLLEKIFDSTLYSTINHRCEQSNRLIVSGDYLKLSDIMELPSCPEGTKVLQIIANMMIYIDQDVVKIGEKFELMIFARTWSIVRNRQFVLDGMKGDDFVEIQSKNGHNGSGHFIDNDEGHPGGRGNDGKPGLPGGNGGNFYGIAEEIIHADKLLISVNGGAGGAGQNGGQGGNGAPGKDADWDNPKTNYTDYNSTIDDNFLSHTTWVDVRLAGFLGGIGGLGGDGGVGGIGGRPGNIYLTVFDGPLRVNISQKHGNKGKDGQGGLGGMYGPDGKYCTQTVKMVSSETGRGEPSGNVTCACSNTTRRAPQGLSGVKYHEIKTPESEMVKSPSKFIPIYHSFLNDAYGKYCNPSCPESMVQIPYNHHVQRRHTLTPELFGTALLVDLIVRNFTQIKAKYWGYDSHDEKEELKATVKAISFITKLERLFAEIQFDPIPLIGPIKQLIIAQRYDDLYEIVYERIVQSNDFTKETRDLWKRKIINSIDSLNIK